MLPSAVIGKEGPLTKTLVHKAKPAKDTIVFATAGSKGCVRVWCSTKKQSLFSFQPLAGSNGPFRRKGGLEEEEGVGSEHNLEEGTVSTGGYTGLHFNESLGVLATVTFDHNIVFYDTLSFERKKEVCYTQFVEGLEIFLVSDIIMKQIIFSHKDYFFVSTIASTID